MITDIIYSPIIPTNNSKSQFILIIRLFILFLLLVNLPILTISIVVVLLIINKNIFITNKMSERYGVVPLNSNLYSTYGDCNKSKYYSDTNPNDDGSCCSLEPFNNQPIEYPVKYHSPRVKLNPRTFVQPEISPRIYEFGHWNYPSNMPTNYNPIRDVTEMDGYNTNKEYSRDNLLITPSPTCFYNEEELSKPENKLFLQRIGPDAYSFSREQTPINSNIGISYTPSLPPRIKDQVCNNDSAYPLFHRIDPQLVRDNQPNAIEQPTRNGYSAKYGELEAGPGTINYEDIYDSRFTGYGDAYRSYSDVNLGQVQYYYSDIDAHRRPNFVIRNKVDHMDFTDPMGVTSPYYIRTAGLDDVKDTVENQYTADSLYHREDMMERLMRKRNSEEWQLKYAPISRASRMMTM